MVSVARRSEAAEADLEKKMSAPPLHLHGTPAPSEPKAWPTASCTLSTAHGIFITEPTQTGQLRIALSGPHGLKAALPVG